MYIYYQVLINTRDRLKKEIANINMHIPESGKELKSPQSSSWTLEESGLWPGLNDWPAWSKMERNSLLSIIVCINFTSQNSGSQWMWAVQTKIGCCTCAGSDGTPAERKRNNLINCIQIHNQITCKHLKFSDIIWEKEIKNREWNDIFIILYLYLYEL